MAEVIPSGVIKLPNFAEIGYNLKRQKTQDALRAEEFSSQFDEIQGNYLAADVDAVQGAYDAVEDARDLYSQDPNNVDYIKALRKAHSYYAKIAGTAKFLADNNRSLSSDYNANPNKYSITSIDAFDLLEKDKSVKRTAEQIILLGQNPLEFGMSYKSDIADPNKAVNLLLESFDRKKNDYMTAEGNYDLDKVREDFKKIMENRSYLPEEKQGAILYQAFEKDLIGDRSLRNPIRPIDVDLINEPIFQEQNPNLFNDYMDGVVNSAMNFVAEQGVSPYAKARDEESKTKGFPVSQWMNIYKETDNDKRKNLLGAILNDPASVNKGITSIEFGTNSSGDQVLELMYSQPGLNKTGDNGIFIAKKGEQPTQEDWAIAGVAIHGVSDPNQIEKAAGGYSTMPEDFVWQDLTGTSVKSDETRKPMMETLKYIRGKITDDYITKVQEEDFAEKFAKDFNALGFTITDPIGVNEAVVITAPNGSKKKFFTNYKKGKEESDPVLLINFITDNLNTAAIERFIALREEKAGNSMSGF